MQESAVPDQAWGAFTSDAPWVVDRDAIEWAREGVERGAGEILLTSMDRDGTEDGYELRLTRAVSEAVDVPVIASGGVGSIADIDALLAAKEPGIEGVVVGRALYDGRIDVAEALRRINRA